MSGPLLNPSSSSSSNCIDISYAGKKFKSDLALGPAPFVTFNRQYIKDGAGSILGSTTAVNLSGKIYPSTPQNGGTTLGSIKQIGPLLDLEQSLKDLFKDNNGDFYIYANNVAVFSGINCKIKNYTCSPTNNNWQKFIDYSIDFEYYEPAKGRNSSESEYRVSSVTDEWSIEPLSDYMYVDYTDGGDFQQPQRFRITRKVGATGVAKSGFMSHFNKSDRGSLEYNGTVQSIQPANHDAYMQARKWVEDRLELPFQPTENINSRFSSKVSNSNVTPGTLFNSLNIYLYDHTRSINYSITDGTYEINDSWTGTTEAKRYLEEITIDASSDDNFVKSITIRGSIKGLEISPYGNINSDNVSGSGLSLHQYLQEGETFSDILDSKYLNALSGWIHDIKPTLYDKAQIALNTRDRTLEYIPTDYSNGFIPPGNPAFRKERPLNPIPINTSETYDPINGTLDYSYTYDNKFKIISGVISESYSISTQGPTDLFAESFVLGRASGPFLFSMGTKTASKKTVDIELIVVPPTSIKGFSIDQTTCPVHTGGFIFKECEGFITAQEPMSYRSGSDIVIKTRNDISWSPTSGKFTRNIEWTYQPCVYQGGRALKFLE